MCARYIIAKDEEEIKRIIERIKLDFNIDLSDIDSIGGILGEVYPSHTAPVITAQNLNYLMKWGYPNLKEGQSPHINARSETALILPTFSEAMLSRRCLIPASAYYEWAMPIEKEGIPKPKRKTKYEFRLPDEEVMYMAGIYSGNGFAVLTRDAAPEIFHIHDRMPLILSKNLADKWLNESHEALKEIFREAITSVEYAPLPSKDDEQPIQMSLFS